MHSTSTPAPRKIIKLGLPESSSNSCYSRGASIYYADTLGEGEGAEKGGGGGRRGGSSEKFCVEFFVGGWGG